MCLVSKWFPSTLVDRNLLPCCTRQQVLSSSSTAIEHKTNILCVSFVKMSMLDTYAKHWRCLRHSIDSLTYRYWCGIYCAWTAYCDGLKCHMDWSLLWRPHSLWVYHPHRSSKVLSCVRTTQRLYCLPISGVQRRTAATTGRSWFQHALQCHHYDQHSGCSVHGGVADCNGEAARGSRRCHTAQ